MNEFRFRVLLLAYFVSVVATVVIGVSEIGYPPELVAAYAGLPEPAILSSNPIALVLLALTLLLSMFAGLLGLFLFKPWGRLLSLASTVAALLLVPFLGPTLTSPMEDLFGDLASLLLGCALGLAYFSPLRARFETQAT